MQNRLTIHLLWGREEVADLTSFCIRTYTTHVTLTRAGEEGYVTRLPQNSYSTIQAGFTFTVQVAGLVFAKLIRTVRHKPGSSLKVKNRSGSWSILFCSRTVNNTQSGSITFIIEGQVEVMDTASCVLVHYHRSQAHLYTWGSGRGSGHSFICINTIPLHHLYRSE